MSEVSPLRRKRITEIRVRHFSERREESYLHVRQEHLRKVVSPADFLADWAVG